MKPFIEVKNLSHSFGEKKVLDNISFQAERGEITGLLGPSGAGKTTLVNLLSGQLKPDAGEIKIGDDAIFQGEGSRHRQGGRGVMPIRESGQAKGSVMPMRRSRQMKGGNGRCTDRSRAGIMMDSFGLYERLSVFENLKIFAGIYRVPEGRIDELLKKAELIQAKRTAVGKLSKGMRSRVNFCRALLKETDILYLDEPTSGLDPATTEKIHEMILEEKNAGTTIFLTTHNMHEAERLCGRVLLLNEGRIVEDGVPAEICRKYNFENKIEVVLKNGEVHRVKNTGESADILGEWLKNGAIAGIHSSEPDLEKVFLGITGRRLGE